MSSTIGLASQRPVEWVAAVSVRGTRGAAIVLVAKVRGARRRKYRLPPQSVPILLLTVSRIRPTASRSIHK